MFNFEPPFRGWCWRRLKLGEQPLPQVARSGRTPLFIDRSWRGGLLAGLVVAVLHERTIRNQLDVESIVLLILHHPLTARVEDVLLVDGLHKTERRGVCRQLRLVLGRSALGRMVERLASHLLSLGRWELSRTARGWQR